MAPKIVSSEQQNRVETTVNAKKGEIKEQGQKVKYTDVYTEISIKWEKHHPLSETFD